MMSELKKVSVDESMEHTKDFLSRSKMRLEIRMEKYQEQANKVDGLNEYQIKNYEETKKEHADVVRRIKELDDSILE